MRTSWQPFCWAVGLIIAGAYEPHWVLRWYNETIRVVSGGFLGTILMSGGLYFGFREMSRLQFIYFFLVNVFLLLGHRALLRIYYRLLGHTRPGWRSRVLIVGAGDLGRQVACQGDPSREPPGSDSPWTAGPQNAARAWDAVRG